MLAKPPGCAAHLELGEVSNLGDSQGVTADLREGRRALKARQQTGEAAELAIADSIGCEIGAVELY
jgi:hypothetical protein